MYYRCDVALHAVSFLLIAVHAAILTPYQVMQHADWLKDSGVSGCVRRKRKLRWMGSIYLRLDPKQDMCNFMEIHWVETLI
jgi:hypothetical protein